MNDNMARQEDALEAWASQVGFERPVMRRPALRYRAICWQLIATLTLALSTLLAATVLTLGYARAGTLVHAEPDHRSLALALFLGLVLAGIGGLTALMAGPARD